MTGKENSNVNLSGVLVVLAGLLFSSVIPIQTSVQAEKFQANPETQKIAVSEQAVAKDYGKMPLIFEENKGQTDAEAKFISRGGGYTLYLTETEAVFSLKVPSSKTQDSSQLENPKTAKKEKTKSDILRLKFAGANQQPTIAGSDESVTKTNYYIGKKQFENVPNYKRVNYKNLYEGIDAVFYGNQSNQLEYDFALAPNADANQIELNFDGAETISIDKQGNLVIKTANTELVQQKPFAYQEIDGERKEIGVNYKIEDQSPKTKDQNISFSVGEYDKSKPLVIDPALNYLTYIGGTGFDTNAEIAADAQGNAYITGSTASLDFPSPGSRVVADAFGVHVAKIDPNGSQFLYVTLLEGDDDDFGFGIAVDANNNAYVSGEASKNFPTTPGAFDENHGTINIADAFAAKLDSTGQISYSTFLGGADQDRAFDIAVDSSGKAYVVGETFSNVAFPTKNRFQGCGFVFPQSLDSLDAFLTVLNASGSDITYSTCIGGSVTADTAFSVAVDSANNAYLTGQANGGNFPTKNASQSESGGGTDAWIAKFNPAISGNNSLIYSTYLGGGGTEKGFSIAVAAGGTASVTGITGSFDFPLQNAIDTTNQINEAFVAQYNSSGAKLNSTFLGGADQDQGLSIALGNGGTIYVTGDTLSNNFPMATPFQSARAGLRDAFVAKIRFGVNNNPGVSSSSYLGGAGNDTGNGIAVRGAFIYISGKTASNNLATTARVPFQPLKATSNASAANPDGFVAKILDTRKDTIGTFNPANTVFNLKNTLAGGAPDIVVDRGAAGDVPVAGDFNGDGIDTVSTFNNGVWKITNFNVLVSGYGTGATTVNFGATGDLPVVGDWNGDGIDTIGVFRPLTGQFLLSNSLAAAPPTDITVIFGTNGDKPVAGDWDGDGIDSTGVFRPTANQFFLTNDNVLGANLDITTNFGSFEDLPVAGDFDGNGTDSIGVWRPSVQTFFLTNDNFGLTNTIVFGASNDRPVIGDWDGKPNQ